MTAHLLSNLQPRAVTYLPTPNRQPHNTLKTPLNAAWSPTWHGSRLSIAQDPFFNVFGIGAATQPSPRRSISPLLQRIAGNKAPLTPRLVRSCFKSWPFVNRIVSYFISKCNTFLKFTEAFPTLWRKLFYSINHFWKIQYIFYILFSQIYKNHYFRWQHRKKMI